MPTAKSNQSKRTAPYRYRSMQEFNLEEYLQHPPMIKVLNADREEAHKRCTSLEDQLEKMRDQQKQTEDQLKASEHRNEILKMRLNSEAAKLDDSQKDVFYNSLIQFTIFIVVNVLIGFGINIATSTSYAWTGWIMISTAITLQIVAFFIPLLAKPHRRTKEAND